MDSSRFDTLTRALTTARSRRGTLASLVGGALGLVELGEIDAHNARKKCKKINDEAKRKTCVRKAKAHNARHRCTPSCGGKECGADGCGGSCGSCATGSLCARGQCVIGQGTCDVGEDDCVAPRTVDNCGPGCLCFTTMENQTRCGDGESGVSSCDPGCDSDADCEGQHPTIPGIFCVKNTGDLCATCPGGPGFCAPPCPS